MTVAKSQVGNTGRVNEEWGLTRLDFVPRICVNCLSKLKRWQSFIWCVLPFLSKRQYLGRNAVVAAASLPIFYKIIRQRTAVELVSILRANPRFRTWGTPPRQFEAVTIGFDWEVAAIKLVWYNIFFDACFWLVLALILLLFLSWLKELNPLIMSVFTQVSYGIFLPGIGNVLEGRTAMPRKRFRWIASTNLCSEVSERFWKFFGKHLSSTLQLLKPSFRDSSYCLRIACRREEKGLALGL